MVRTTVLDFSISVGKYADYCDQIIKLSLKERSSYVCVANVHMLTEANKDQSFQKVIYEADIVTPDGKPLVWVLRLLNGIRQERVAGMYLMQDILYRAEIHKLPVFFYGGTGEMLERTQAYIRNEYPGLKIAGMSSPPFRPLTKDEEEEMISIINQSGARIVLVALGCPKQERWMAQMKGRINAVMVGIGGALPVMIGMQKKAPQWMQRSGLEWLFRLWREPKRLFRRYAITNSLFLWLLIKEFISVKFLKRRTTSGIQ